MAGHSRFNVEAVFVTEEPGQAVSVLPKIEQIVTGKMLVWSRVTVSDLKRKDIIIFDLDVSKLDNVERLRKLKAGFSDRQQIVFVVNKGDHKAMSQTNALGARYTVKRPIDIDELCRTLTDICLSHYSDQAQVKEVSALEKRAAGASLAISDLMDSFTTAVRKGGKLPVEELFASSKQIVDVFREADMDIWLKAVKSHSSYTYRHTMLVTGFAAAFSESYRLSKPDRERLTLGALIHDVGKVKIPSKVLDKPGKLTDREVEMMRRHPIEGAQILQRDKRLEKEMVMIARSHHELLDGTGYPDGLEGDEIPDIVRVMTVVDIFSALVEARSYKHSMPVDQAYDMLVEMGPKLDQDIVRAFEPVAFDRATNELILRINETAA